MRFGVLAAAVALTLLAGQGAAQCPPAGTLLLEERFEELSLQPAESSFGAMLEGGRGHWQQDRLLGRAKRKGRRRRERKGKKTKEERGHAFRALFRSFCAAPHFSLV